MWPFTRKPKPINPGPINEDWARGDLAECLRPGGEDWHPFGDGPVKGDVCKVVNVVTGVDMVLKKDAWGLELSGWPAAYFAADAFRKVPPLNSAADAEFAAKIKGLKPKVKA